MQIEFREGKGKQPWRWNVRNGGNITACGEHHDTLKKAQRAAYAVANGYYRVAMKAGMLLRMPVFSEPVWHPRTRAWVVKIGFPGLGN